MSAVAEVIQECHRAGLTLRVADGCIRVRPRSRLTPELADAIKTHKPEILDALAETLSKTSEKRVITPRPEHDKSDRTSTRGARTELKYVTCESCAHWTGESPCGAGLHTSGDPIPGVAVRICGFHIPKGVRS